MSFKSERQRIIKEVIAGKAVRSQDELQDILGKRGMNVTQATLSRDFKELGVVKVHDQAKGEYVYTVQDETVRFVSPDKHVITTDGIRSIEFSTFFAVVKTHPGFASAVATIIDNNVAHEIVGTIAGDDTVLLILREGYTKSQVMSAVARFIPGIQSKLI